MTRLAPLLCRALANLSCLRQRCRSLYRYTVLHFIHAVAHIVDIVYVLPLSTLSFTSSSTLSFALSAALTLSCTISFTFIGIAHNIVHIIVHVIVRVIGIVHTIVHDIIHVYRYRSQYRSHYCPDYRSRYRPRCPSHPRPCCRPAARDEWIPAEFPGQHLPPNRAEVYGTRGRHHPGRWKVGSNQWNRCGGAETPGGWVGGDFCPRSFLAAAPGAGRRHATGGKSFSGCCHLLSAVIGVFARDF